MTDASITERDLPSDPSRVWEHLVDPDRLGEWLGAEIDLDGPDQDRIKPGDEGTIHFDGAEGPSVVLVEEVEDGERLAFRWASSSEAPTEVSIELAPIPRGTRIRIVERPLPMGSRSRHVSMSMSSLATVA